MKHKADPFRVAVIVGGGALFIYAAILLAKAGWVLGGGLW